MLYASQYRNKAHIFLERSCVERAPPSAATFLNPRASKDAAAGKASAAVAHPYRVRNVGVKKKTAHPIIGRLALSSANPSAVDARRNPASFKPHCTPRNDLCALRSSTRRRRRIGKKNETARRVPRDEVFPFGEIPAATTLIGAAVIIPSTLYVVWAENRKNEE